MTIVKKLAWAALALLPLHASAQDAMKELDTPYVPTPQVAVT